MRKKQRSRCLCLAALAGESIILLGPPGVAKSMEAYESLEGFDKIYYDGIMERMEADDTNVFELIEDTELKYDLTSDW